MGDSYAVDVQEVSKSFGAFKALNGVTLRVRQGEIYGLLGPNGAGKTTLIRLICGLLEAHAGTVTVLGQRMPNVGVLRHIGYMTQQAALYPALSVEENVSFFAAINGADGGVKEALELVQLYDRRSSVVATLSGGMRQRCSLACALVHRPELLLLDEPTVGIDPQLRVDADRRLVEEKQLRTVHQRARERAALAHAAAQRRDHRAAPVVQLHELERFLHSAVRAVDRGEEADVLLHRQ